MPRLAPKLARLVPPEVTQEVQAWLILAGLVGLVLAFILPPETAVRIINVVVMVTLVTTGLAGLDSTRRNAQEHGE